MAQNSHINRHFLKLETQSYTILFVFMNTYSWSSSTCPWRATSAGVYTSAAAAALCALTSAGWDSAGWDWLHTYSCCCSSSGRHTPATSCWRPTACWPSSCLRCVPGLCWWVCCSSIRSGRDQLQISPTRATRSYDSETNGFFRHSFKHFTVYTHLCAKTLPFCLSIHSLQYEFVYFKVGELERRCTA